MRRVFSAVLLVLVLCVDNSESLARDVKSVEVWYSCVDNAGDFTRTQKGGVWKVAETDVIDQGFVDGIRQIAILNSKNKPVFLGNALLDFNPAFHFHGMTARFFHNPDTRS